MLENAHETIIIKQTVNTGECTGRPINIIPKIITNIPFTTPRTVPPIIYAIEISIADNGAVNISGNC